MDRLFLLECVQQNTEDGLSFVGCFELIIIFLDFEMWLMFEFSV